MSEEYPLTVRLTELDLIVENRIPVCTDGVAMAAPEAEMSPTIVFGRLGKGLPASRAAIPPHPS
jgi:hypothetical protein